MIFVNDSDIYLSLCVFVFFSMGAMRKIGIESIDFEILIILG